MDSLQRIRTGMFCTMESNGSCEINLFGRCGIVRPTSGIGLPFLVLSVLLRLLFFRGIVFVLDFFTELLFNHLGKGQDFCNIGSAEQKIVIFMHRIHAHLLHCVRKELCNSRIIKVKLTIIFSITRQASECAIIDFLEDRRFRSQSCCRGTPYRGDVPKALNRP